MYENVKNNLVFWQQTETNFITKFYLNRVHGFYHPTRLSLVILQSTLTIELFIV